MLKIFNNMYWLPFPRFLAPEQEPLVSPPQGPLVSPPQEPLPVGNMAHELYNAATWSSGDTDPLLDLCRHGRIDDVTSDGNTVLHLLALKNRFIPTEAILREFPQVLQRTNSRYETALHLAAERGYFLVVEQLIAKSTDLNLSAEAFIRKANSDGNTALHLAARKNQLTVVRYIVEKDPNDQHSKNNNSETPVYLAAMMGHRDVLELILRTCTSAAIDGPDGKTAVHAAVISRDAGCLDVILQHRGHLLNEVDKDGWTAMHHAASHNCVSLLETIHLKETGQSSRQNLPQAMDNPIKKTPLHIAAMEGHTSSVLELMRIYDSTSDIISAVDEDDRNILHIAVDQNHKELVKSILESVKSILSPGPSIHNFLNATDKNGNTPLHLLVKRGCFVPELIKHDLVKQDAENNEKLTPADLLYLDEDIVQDQLKIKEALDEVQHGQRRKFWGKNSRPQGPVNNTSVPSSRLSTKDKRQKIYDREEKGNERKRPGVQGKGNNSDNCDSTNNYSQLHSRLHNARWLPSR